MIYLKRDNKRRQKKTALVVGILAGFILLAVLLNFFSPNFFSPVSHAIFRPVLESESGFWGGVRNVWNVFKSKSDLAAENQALQDKLALLDATAQERDYYKNANDQLLSLADQSSDLFHPIFAKILSKVGFSPYDTMIIDAGGNAGIKTGDKVSADEDIILGFVSKTYAKTAMVTLYSSPGQETPVLIGKHSVQAVAVGKGGGNFEIKLPRNASIAVGDNVSAATSSPALIGSVEYIAVSATDSFERAVLRSAADINNLSFLVILKP